MSGVGQTIPFVSLQTRLGMNNRAQGDSLEKLRADLRHFEEREAFGENPAVIEIKNHLLRRIAEIESAKRRTSAFEAAASRKLPNIHN
jgi:ABC-type uncharacterized transport system auxiliary subunit